MIQASQIKEHMEVVGSDRKHVGKVDHMMGADIELAKFDFGSGLKHHQIPLSWVEDIEGDQVRLNLTADQAKSRWRDAPH